MISTEGAGRLCQSPPGYTIVFLGQSGSSSNLKVAGSNPLPLAARRVTVSCLGQKGLINALKCKRIRLIKSIRQMMAGMALFSLFLWC